MRDTYWKAEVSKQINQRPETMFFEFGVKDIIDIVLVALMLYYIYRLR